MYYMYVSAVHVVAIAQVLPITSFTENVFVQSEIVSQAKANETFQCHIPYAVTVYWYSVRTTPMCSITTTIMYIAQSQTEWPYLHSCL